MLTKPTAKKRGRRPQLFTQVQVAQAVTEAGGTLTTAARKLGCARCTVHEYIQRYQALKDVLSEARESSVDLAESKLMEAINAGNLTAIIFFLKTQGKSRGYSERSEFGHPTDDEPITFTMNIGDKGNAGNDETDRGTNGRTNHRFQAHPC